MTQATSENTDSFAARLVLALRAVNFSRGQLAAAVGVDKSLVSRWASGQVVPTDYNLARISDALAKIKPGFNMTLWHRPRAEFDAFFGAATHEAPPTEAVTRPSNEGLGTPPARTPSNLAQLLGGLNPWTVIAASGLLIVIFAGFWTVFGTARQSKTVTVAAVQEAAEGSVAVLPFANTSGDPNQRYFGEGLSDELIGLLARNAALRVAARTSSYAFEGKNEDVRLIAHNLNVRAVLEGSVRIERGRVRIEASLINGANGYQVWSQSYDRSLGDILLVQADIARAIASALIPKLSDGRGSVPQAHAIDPVAYRLYLEGLFDMNQRRVDAENAALPLLRQAVALAPDFAAAEAALAYDLNIVAGTKKRLGPNPERDAALSKALSLDPTNPLALCLSIALALQDRKWDKAIDMALVLKRSTNHGVDALRGLSDVYEEFGLSALRLGAWQEAVRLDPLSYNARMNLADTYLSLSKKPEALETVKDALKLSPGNPDGTAAMCNMLASTKQIAAAKAVRESMIISGASQNDLNDCQFLIAKAMGDSATPRAICEDTVAHYPKNGLSEFDLGFCFASASEFDRALDWFERAFDKGEDIFTLPFENDFSPALFRNPRWIALTRRPSYQLWSEARARALRELAGG